MTGPDFTTVVRAAVAAEAVPSPDHDHDDAPRRRRRRRPPTTRAADDDSPRPIGFLPEAPAAPRAEAGRARWLALLRRRRTAAATTAPTTRPTPWPTGSRRPRRRRRRPCCSASSRAAARDRRRRARRRRRAVPTGGRPRGRATGPRAASPPTSIEFELDVEFVADGGLQVVQRGAWRRDAAVDARGARPCSCSRSAALGACSDDDRIGEAEDGIAAVRSVSASGRTPATSRSSCPDDAVLEAGATLELRRGRRRRRRREAVAFDIDEDGSVRLAAAVHPHRRRRGLPRHRAGHRRPRPGRGRLRRGPARGPRRRRHLRPAPSCAPADGVGFDVTVEVQLRSTAASPTRVATTTATTVPATPPPVDPNAADHHPALNPLGAADPASATVTHPSFGTGPRSSADRASASGAVCERSSRPGAPPKRGPHLRSVAGGGTGSTSRAIEVGASREGSPRPPPPVPGRAKW